jgi:hypothetical protein
VIVKPHVDWFAISPELVLLGVAALALFIAVLAPRWARKALAAFVCAGGFLGAFVSSTTARRTAARSSRTPSCATASARSRC